MTILSYVLVKIGTHGHGFHIKFHILGVSTLDKFSKDSLVNFFLQLNLCLCFVILFACPLFYYFSWIYFNASSFISLQMNIGTDFEIFLPMLDFIKIPKIRVCSFSFCSLLVSLLELSNAEPLTGCVGRWVTCNFDCNAGCSMKPLLALAVIL